MGFPLNEALIVFGIAIALGCDALTVGLAIGTTNPDRRQSFRLFFHFGLFQFLMTLAGWELGRKVLKYIEAIDHWVAFGLLFAVAYRMLRESLKEETGEVNDNSMERKDPTRGLSLIALCLATSMDALGVGFGMSMANRPLLVPAVIIGITAGVMTYAGIKFGTRLSKEFGKRVETLGAIILFLIAFKLLSI